MRYILSANIAIRSRRTDYYDSGPADWRYWIYVKDTGEEKTTWGECLYREI